METAILIRHAESEFSVLGHALPIAYALGGPTPRIDLVDYVRPFRLGRGELEAAVERLERWTAAPSW
jgi:hypothetical protein